MIVVGLMSGTSLDGISAAAVEFADDPSPAVGDGDFQVRAFVQIPYTTAQRDRLAAALVTGTPADYCRLNFDLGAWLAEAAMTVIEAAGLAPERVRAIASHGQTVWHEAGHSTWQTGESAVIAERTGVDVVSDFRVRDVAASGQGAPLVPIADALLFAPEHGWRALQNLGGMANVTVVPARGAAVEAVRAFDTGPGVAVIDAVVRRLLPELPYDVDGRLGRAGAPIDAVVDELLAAPYFASPPPKSTGRELFDRAYVDRFLALCRASQPEAREEHIVATAVALTARSIGDAYRRFVPEPLGDVLLSGGGARNPTLVDAIGRELAPRHVRRFDDVYFDGEAKEAVAFAFLGRLHLAGRAGNVPSATGARGPRVLGKLTPK
ncbi:MAG TPA: anhydro-N-acetylmuramic acid kinase [Gemmatimonadaceae bacterium]|nr:anhydro-N-acetylmuramic acid kinase [Gemmatimonadaceae bacterium]